MYSLIHQFSLISVLPELQIKKNKTNHILENYHLT